MRQGEVDEGRRTDVSERARSVRRSRSCARENKELRRANEILKAASACFSRGELDPQPTEVSAFIDEHAGVRGRADLPDLGRVGVRRTTQRASGARSARLVEDERLLGVIRASCTRSNYDAYGSRRMWKALLRDGEQVGARARWSG